MDLSPLVAPTITSYLDTWDPANNRLSRIEQDGTRVTWSHDATYQLTNEQRSGANSYNTTYAYDPAGNRRLKLDNSIRTTYSFDGANQLQKYVDNTGTTTFSFDASGNQRLQIASAGGGTTTNTWDYENRLSKVALPSAVLNTFAYNGEGLRVQRQDSSGTSKQIWDGQKIVEETDQSNVVLVIYSQSDGEYGDVISQRRSGASRYFQYDPLGSTTRLTDGAQSATDSYLFKAFGESLLAAGPTTNTFTYIGKLGYSWSPDTGWYCLRERWLQAVVGRLLTVDPLRFRQDANLYRYVRNMPTSAVDPSGLLALVDCDAISALQKKRCATGLWERYKFCLKTGPLFSNCISLYNKICCTLDVVTASLCGDPLGVYPFCAGLKDPDSCYHCMATCEISLSCGGPLVAIELGGLLEFLTLIDSGFQWDSVTDLIADYGGLLCYAAGPPFLPKWARIKICECCCQKIGNLIPSA